MAFAFGKLAFILLRPSNLLLLLALLGLAASWRRPRAWGRALLALSLGLMLVATLLPVGHWLLAPLEDRFPRPAAYPARIDGAVVLGGGVSSDLTAARGTPAFSDPGERYMAMLELARRYPQARIIFTGGVGRLEGGVPPETETIALLLEQHGLAGRVLLESRARTTEENALHALADGGAGTGPGLAAGDLGRAHAALDRRLPPDRLGAGPLAGRLPDQRHLRLGVEPQAGRAPERA